MDARTLRVLEFDKIRERLARFTSFSLGRERVLALLPTDDIRLAQDWQAETREARRCSTRRATSIWAACMICAAGGAGGARQPHLLPTDLLGYPLHPAARAHAPPRS